MAVPYHTHSFEIPSATRDEVEAGVRTDVAATPASLGSAASKDISYFATAGQGTKADTAVQPTLILTAGNGLTGGGTLAGNRTFALSSTSLASLALANSAVQKVNGKAGTSLVLSAADVGAVPDTFAADIAANTAARHTHSNKTILDAVTASYTTVEKTKLSGIANGADKTPVLAPVATLGTYNSLTGRPSLGSLASKNSIETTDISASGTPSNATFLRGDGAWVTVSGSGTVTSVAMTVPTGLTVSGSPINASGNFAVAYASGYTGYTTAEKTKLAGIPAGADKTVLSNVTAVLHTAELGQEIDEAVDRIVYVKNGDPAARRTGWPTVKTWINGWLTKSDVGLGNVDNTADAAKPISTATQAALNGKLNTNGKAADSSLLNGQTAAQLPVSNATTTALNAKFDKSGGTITNDVTLSKNGAPLTLNSLSARANTSAGSANTGGFLSSQIGVDIIASFYAFEQVGSHTQATISLSPGGGSPNTFLTFRGNGSLQVPGALSKGSGTFLIDHPLDPLNKNLRHGFAEAPEYLNIYRGVVDLEAGRMAVDIDAAFGMTDGTFAALNVEVCVFVQTQYSPEKVWIEAPADSGKFTIVSENAQSNATIAFMVTGRRNDAFVRSELDPNTDSEGRFIPEYEKED